MATRIHSTWLNTRNTRIYCVDLSSFNDDPDGLTREIDAARAVIEHLPENSLLVSLDLHSTRLTVEIERFLRDITRPVRKMAVLGVPGLRRDSQITRAGPGCRRGGRPAPRSRRAHRPARS